MEKGRKCGNSKLIRMSMGFEDVEGPCSDPENNKKAYTCARRKAVCRVSCMRKERSVSLNKTELVPPALDLTVVGGGS